MTRRHWIPVVLLAFGAFSTQAVVVPVVGQTPRGSAAVRPDEKSLGVDESNDHLTQQPVSTDGLEPGERAALLEMAESWALATAVDELGMSKPHVVALNTTVTPLSGELRFVAKVADDSGHVEELVFTRRGNSLSPADLTDELEIHVQNCGKIAQDLADVLRVSPADQPIEVLIWCRTPEGLEPVARPDWVSSSPTKDGRAVQGGRVEVEPMEPIAADGLEQLMQLHTREVAAELIEQGLQPRVQTGAPLISVSLTPGQIESTATHPGVLEIYQNAICEQLMVVERQVTRAHVVQSRGITGSGVRVGVVEVGGGIVANHPWLRFTQHAPYAEVNDHAALVAGVIASRHSQHQGIATGVQMFVGGSGSGRADELIDVMHASRQWGARIINNSWGSTSPDRRAGVTSRACDQMAMWHHLTVVVAAGNNGMRSDSLRGLVGDPGRFYSGLTVGASDTRQSVSTWDDQMAPYSSDVNPFSANNDRQKPDLVAPGGGIENGSGVVSTINESPFLGAESGTSFAAPMVAGGAALMMQRRPALQYWPEAVKAILMATAMQNIEGNTRLSNSDGVGSIQLDRADDAVRGVGRSGCGGLLYDTNRGVVTDAARVNLVAGKRVRIVIAWNQNPNYHAYSSRPCADLDLQILRPNGSVQVGSYSWDNTFEIVDFTPTHTGSHTIRIRRHRIDMTPGGVGYAWYQLP